MSSKESIIKRIKQNKPLEVAHPGYPNKPVQYSEPLVNFSEILTQIGGKVTNIDHSGIAGYLDSKYSDKKIVCSSLYFPIVNLDPQSVNDPHDLKFVDLAILEAAFGVAENGSLFFGDKALNTRALCFITQHLVVLLNKENMVQNMHEAMERIDDETSFGLFMAGPSKTADIEQSLVIGAHGSRSLEVLIY